MNQVGLQFGIHPYNKWYYTKWFCTRKEYKIWHTHLLVCFLRWTHLNFGFWKMNVQNIWQNVLLPNEHYHEDFMSLTSTFFILWPWHCWHELGCSKQASNCVKFHSGLRKYSEKFQSTSEVIFMFYGPYAMTFDTPWVQVYPWVKDDDR